jgi:hypothetical protein
VTCPEEELPGSFLEGIRSRKNPSPVVYLAMAVVVLFNNKENELLILYY